MLACGKFIESNIRYFTDEISIRMAKGRDRSKFN